jgi:hypothetical protein
MNALLQQLHDDTVLNPNLTDLDKAFIAEKIAQVILHFLYFQFFLCTTNAVCNYFYLWLHI